MQKLLSLLVVVSFFVLSSTQLTAQERDINNRETTLALSASPMQGGRSTTDNPRYNDLMLPNTSGVFRGISFDMSKEEVLEIESVRSTVDIYLDETDDELIVTSDMGREILDFADITYRFDEQGLYGIKVETYAVSFEGATEDFDMIVDYYTKKFAKPVISDVDGYYEFSANDKVSGNDYQIAIKNIDDVDDSYGMYMYFDIK